MTGGASSLTNHQSLDHWNHSAKNMVTPRRPTDGQSQSRTTESSLCSVDDQGSWALACTGNGEIRSPNLDRLAREGIRFDNFFCASPVCSPARASILTGRIPSQHGVHDFLSMPHDREGKPDLNTPANSIQFLADMPTYVEMLAELGYHTCLSGKWHLGDSLQPRCGFQAWYPMPYGQSSFRNVPMVEDGQYTLHEDTYASDLFTDNALGFLARQVDEDRPFCLNLHYTAPHRPWGREDHPEEIWDDYYNNCPFDSTPGLDERSHQAFSDILSKDHPADRRPPPLMPKSESNTSPVISRRSKRWTEILVGCWSGWKSRTSEATLWSCS